jgi:hypothetical protein
MAVSLHKKSSARAHKLKKKTELRALFASARDLSKTAICVRGSGDSDKTTFLFRTLIALSEDKG